jgi:arabinose-5-phosphate isomerase
MSLAKDIALETISKEIEAIEGLKLLINEDFEKAIKVIYESRGKVILTGVGKSGHIARKIASTMASVGTPAIFLHPNEALHGDLGIITEEDVVLALSNSGESSEIVSMIPYTKMIGSYLISITNKKDSTLSKQSDISIVLNVEKEACPLNLAPTSSTTAMLVLGDAMAMSLLKLSGFKEEDFALLHPAGLLGRKLKQVKDVAHFGQELPVVKKDAKVYEAIIEITKKGFGATAVVDEDEKLIGILTDGDIRRILENKIDINNTNVYEVCTKSPKTVSKTNILAKALSLMEQYKITVLIVEEDEKPIGIVHLHDILRSGIN